MAGAKPAAAYALPPALVTTLNSAIVQPLSSWAARWQAPELCFATSSFGSSMGNEVCAFITRRCLLCITNP